MSTLTTVTVELDENDVQALQYGLDKGADAMIALKKEAAFKGWTDEAMTYDVGLNQIKAVCQKLSAACAKAEAESTN